MTVGFKSLHKLKKGAFISALLHRMILYKEMKLPGRRVFLAIHDGSVLGRTNVGLVQGWIQDLEGRRAVLQQLLSVRM